MVQNAELDHYELAQQIRPTLWQLHFMIRRRTPGPELTPAQSSVLQTLHADGPMRMGELARRQRIRLPSTTSAIDGLERIGLVERKADPSDRRAVIVGLSRVGAELTDSLVKERNELLAGFLTHLSAEDRASLQAAIPAISHLVELYRDHGPS